MIVCASFLLRFFALHRRIKQAQVKQFHSSSSSSSCQTSFQPVVEPWIPRCWNFEIIEYSRVEDPPQVKRATWRTRQPVSGTALEACPVLVAVRTARLHCPVLVAVRTARLHCPVLVAVLTATLHCPVLVAVRTARLHCPVLVVVRTARLQSTYRVMM
jgi:hypothetical protein